ncbi:hypothetical protein ABZY02_33125 [Streptomyces sp. NPDC006649]|uniref:hypothetical protein n=1 Tax=Streptomyces sp. NPDC006649 TaxID=3156896 RepID=UPI0033A0F5E7
MPQVYERTENAVATNKAAGGEMAARIGHVVDVRDTRPAFGITYRRYQDIRSSHVRVQADDVDDAMAALTAHVGNTYYVVTSIRPE